MCRKLHHLLYFISMEIGSRVTVNHVFKNTEKWEKIKLKYHNTRVFPWSTDMPAQMWTKL